MSTHPTAAAIVDPDMTDLERALAACEVFNLPAAQVFGERRLLALVHEDDRDWFDGLRSTPCPRSPKTPTAGGLSPRPLSA
jgi:hypothetical protein